MGHLRAYLIPDVLPRGGTVLPLASDLYLLLFPPTTPADTRYQGVWIDCGWPFGLRS